MLRRGSLKSTITRAGSFWAVALALVIAGAGVAQAQYYYYGNRPPPPPQRGFFPFFAPFQSPAPSSRGVPSDAPERPADYSRAPAPKKSDTVPERSVVVLGDAMADWLAYGLEDAFSETPEIGVIRKHRTVSGLIRYQPRGAPEDWIAAARDILANEKPSAILIMLGLNDRQSIREVVAERNPNAKGAAGAAKPEGQQAKPEGEQPEAAQVPDDEQDETPAIAAPERSTTRSAGGLHEFRSEKWIELYRKKIADMIAVAKTKGVPVLWIGLPAIRGQRSTADVLFLDGLYREEASKAGITYVDVWDGFVDERGAFLNSGPDLEGQTRRLRAQDGVYFTRAGARKLAHYAERELTRLFQNRITPVALPSDAGTPDTARPGVPAPRPLAGPIVPLAAPSVNNDQLLGGAGSRPVFVDAVTARILVKGEPLPAPAGRADDFAWPRREVGTPDTLPLTEAAAPPQTAPPAALTSTNPSDSPAPQRPRQAGQPGASPAGQAKQPPRRPDGAPRQQQADGVPRPPGSVGPSAQVPRQRSWFFW